MRKFIASRIPACPRFAENIEIITGKQGTPVNMSGQSGQNNSEYFFICKQCIIFASNLEIVIFAVWQTANNLILNFYMILLLFFMMIFTDISAQQHPAERLPEQFGPYRVTERLDYNAENLFDYINGGAEMYLSYGLTGMKGRVYSAENLPDVRVEIYEMTEAKNAFGVFTQTRDKEEDTYGQGSLSYRDAAIFWKDRYYTVVSASQITPESEEAVRFLASAVDKAISGEGKIPDIVACLPEKDLAAAGYTYFHHYIWLNSYYFIADFNILNIDAQTDAVIAKYGSPEQRSYLLMIEYPDDITAQKAYEQMKEQYAPETETSVVVSLENNTWFALWIKGNRVGSIFNGVTREITEQLYQNAYQKM